MKNLFIKKVLANKLNLFPMLFVLLPIGMVLFFNWRSGGDFELVNQITSEQAELQVVISQLQEELAKPNLDSQSQDHLKDSLTGSQAQLANNQELLSAWEDQDYTKAYSLMAEKMQQRRKGLSSHQNSQAIEALKRDEAYYRYLSEKNLKGDSIQSVFGLTFTYEIWRDYLPVLLTVAIVFVLSQVYSQAYYDHLPIYLLRPGNFLFRASHQMLGGLLFSISICILSLIFSCMLGTFFFEIGSLDLPVLIYDEKLQMVWQPLKDQLGQASILQLLSLVSLVVTIYFISFAVKDKLLTVLISLISTVGLMILTYLVVPLQEIAHWIPFNYLQSLAVVCGQHHQAIEINRLEVSFGIGINLAYSVIVLGLIYLLDQTRRKRYWNCE